MLDKKDIALLEKAKKDNLSIDEVIEKAKYILALNEEKNNLIQVKQELDYKFREILEKNIEEIYKLKNPKEKLDFLITKSFELYEIEEKARLEEIKKQEELEKQNLEDTKEKQV